MTFIPFTPSFTMKNHSPAPLMFSHLSPFPFLSSILLLPPVSHTIYSCPHSSRLKLVEGKDCFILEACFADTVFNTMAQPFSKPNEVRSVHYLILPPFLCVFTNNIVIPFQYSSTDIRKSIEKYFESCQRNSKFDL